MSNGIEALVIISGAHHACAQLSDSQTKLIFVLGHICQFDADVLETSPHLSISCPMRKFNEIDEIRHARCITLVTSIELDYSSCAPCPEV